MLLIPLLFACVKVNGTDDVVIAADLPAMSRGCDVDNDDVTDANGDRVFGMIEPQGGDCRGVAYAKVKALDWKDVRNDVGDKKATWLEFVTALQGASVVTTPQVDLTGATVRLLQLVSTKSGDLGKYEANPQSLIDILGSVADNKIVGSDLYVLSFEHTFTGDEPEDLVDLLPNGVDGYAFNDVPGPIATIQASFDKDPSLYVLTVGEVVIPISTLEDALPIGTDDKVEVTIDLLEAMDYRIKVSLL